MCRQASQEHSVSKKPSVSVAHYCTMSHLFSHRSTEFQSKTPIYCYTYMQALVVQLAWTKTWHRNRLSCSVVQLMERASDVPN